MGGCASSAVSSVAPADPVHDDSCMLIQLLGARNVPKADILSESDAYVAAYVAKTSNPKKPLSDTVRTLWRRDTPDPEWRAFRCITRVPEDDPNDPNVLVCVLNDYDSESADDELGRITINCKDLTLGHQCDLNFGNLKVNVNNAKGQRKMAAKEENKSKLEMIESGELDIESVEADPSRNISPKSSGEYRKDGSKDDAGSASISIPTDTGGSVSVSGSPTHLAVPATTSNIDPSLRPRTAGPTVIKVVRQPFPGTYTKTLFLIRHGESEWNAAQAEKRFHKMLAYDHPLNPVGIEQARQLNRRLRAAAPETFISPPCITGPVGGAPLSPTSSEPKILIAPPTESEIQKVKEFTSCRALYCSPLTRALQTCLCALDGLPTVRESGVKLLAQAREIKKIGGMDTVGKECGYGIVKRAEDCLVPLVGAGPAKGLMLYRDEGVISSSCVDPYDCTSEWWTELSDKDTKESLDDRYYDFMCTLLYGNPDERTAIVVGHSLFFLEFMKRYAKFSPDALAHLTAKDPSLPADLLKYKLGNAGCLAVEMNFAGSPCITDARLLFGSTLVKKEKKEKKEK